MRTLTATLATAAALLMPATAQALPTLPVSDAKGYAKKALERNYGREWRNADYRWVRNCARRSRTKVICRNTRFGSVPTQMGGVGYAGRVTIWYTRDRRGTMWNYSYRIKRTDYDCMNAGGSNCVSTEIVT